MEIQEIIHELQNMGLIRPHKISGDYYTCYCPIHSGGKEKKPSFGILLKDQVRNGQVYPAGFCNCFTCHTSGMLKDVMQRVVSERNISSKSVTDKLESIFQDSRFNVNFDYLLPNDTSQALLNKYAIDYINTLAKVPSQTYVSDEELAKYRYTVQYHRDRGLTDEILNLFDVGFQADWIPPGKKHPVPCITIPVRDKQGRTLFICRRSIEGKMYNYPEGVTKPLFGIDVIPKGCKSLLLVESAINAMTATKWGYPAVALLGTGNSFQLQQLKELGIPNIVLCFDGDDGGRRATVRWKRELQKTCMVWSISMPEGKDVNDCDKATFDLLYQERE